MPLFRIPVDEMARSLRIPGATQWGRGATSDEPGKHPMNASRRVHRPRLPIWPGEDQARIDPGATIYAMGSCFAREIERVLGAKGFPMASFIEGTDDEGTRDVTVTNRYNTASMLLELRRLLEGPEVLPDDALAIPMGDGLVLDAHYHTAAKVTPAELVARRRRFHAHFQSIREADALILTLGLNEAALDLDSGLYRNRSPNVRELRSGERVEVHSFTTAENVAFLEEILDLVRRHCRRDPAIFITVSPVPLSLTYQHRDIVVANCEGKSILRAAAAEFCAAHPDVTYFHSYEMALNADPSVVFKGDHLHLRKGFIATIVDAFLERHCPTVAATAEAQEAEAL